MRIPKVFKYILYTVLGLVVFILIVTIGNTIKISSSEEYEIAKKYLTTNSKLIEEIGEVKEFGNFPSGSIRKENGAEFAQIETTVEGGKSKAKVVLLMSKTPLGEWSFDEIYFEQP